MLRLLKAFLTGSLAAATPAASGKAFIDWGTFTRVYTEATYYDHDDHAGYGSSEQKYNDWPNTLDMHDTASTRFTRDGFDGLARARADVVFPPGATIGSRFSCVSIDLDAYGRLNSVNTRHTWEQAIADATQEIGLRVTAPIRWSFTADVAGDSDPVTWVSRAVYSFEIWNPTFTRRYYADELRSEKDVGDFATRVSLNGSLQPGSYAVRISAYAQQADAGFGDAIGEARATISNGVFCVVPAPGGAMVLAFAGYLAPRRRRRPI